jgi:hypothetical protein
MQPASGWGFLVKTLRNVVAATNDLNPRGMGWTIVFETEYDFQNLFFIALPLCKQQDDLPLAPDRQLRTQRG